MFIGCGLVGISRRTIHQGRSYFRCTRLWLGRWDHCWIREV